MQLNCCIRMNAADPGQESWNRLSSIHFLCLLRRGGKITMYANNMVFLKERRQDHTKYANSIVFLKERMQDHTSMQTTASRNKLMWGTKTSSDWKKRQKYTNKIARQSQNTWTCWSGTSPPIRCGREWVQPRKFAQECGKEKLPVMDFDNQLPKNLIFVCSCPSGTSRSPRIRHGRGNPQAEVSTIGSRPL